MRQSQFPDAPKGKNKTRSDDTMKKQKITVRHLTFSALIAALYVLLTWMLGEYAYGPIQFRISECMTVLPYLFPFASVGLTIGCFLANLFSTAGALDLLIGPLATLIGAVGTQLCAKKKLWWLAPLPPVLSNALLIGAMLTFLSDAPSGMLFGTMALQIGISQAICCYAIGLPLLFTLGRIRQKRIPELRD